MPVHDWTRVDAGIFHDFHVSWIPEIRKVLNGGLLPDGYYALAEQHAGRSIPDLLTLHTSAATQEPVSLPSTTGGTAVAESPPRARRKQTVAPAELLTRPRTLAIRHVSGHRLVALLEIVSPANKDRARSVDEFAAKVASALRAGVHVLFVDLFPPGRFDPAGMHGAVWAQLEDTAESVALPPGEPMTLASYVAERDPTAYLEYVGVGASLPEMALFLTVERYIKLPLEATYQEAYRGMPEFWRELLEDRRA
jgi:hypothetical protein